MMDHSGLILALQNLKAEWAKPDRLSFEQRFKLIKESGLFLGDANSSGLQKLASLRSLGVSLIIINLNKLGLRNEGALAKKIFSELYTSLFLTGSPALLWSSVDFELPDLFKNEVTNITGLYARNPDSMLWSHPSVKNLQYYGSRELSLKIAKEIQPERMRYRIYTRGMNTAVILDEAGLEEFRKSTETRSSDCQDWGMLPKRILGLDSFEKKMIVKFPQAQLHHPLCEPEHHSEIQQENWSLNTVKYVHEFAKWINNPGFADLVEVWGDAEKAARLIPKLDVARAFINSSWTIDQSASCIGPQIFVGDSGERFFGDWILSPAPKS